MTPSKRPSGSRRKTEKETNQAPSRFFYQLQGSRRGVVREWLRFLGVAE